AKIELLGWRAIGLRCPDHEVDLRNGAQPYPVSLIQMPNGTGKTTTLNLLRATLSGSAEQLSKSEISGLRRRGDSGKKGEFVVRLNVDSHLMTLELKLDFESGSVKYRTSVGSGVKEGFFPPKTIARFLTPAFVEL